MPVTTGGRLVGDYLAALDAASAVLPPDQRAELRSEIEEHLAEALREVGDGDEAAVRGVLDRLGSPSDIVAEQLGAAPQGVLSQPPQAVRATAGTWGPVEIAAVGLLTVGALVLPLLGPLLGIAFAGVSRMWTRKEKVIASVWALLWIPALVLALLVWALSTPSTPSL